METCVPSCVASLRGLNHLVVHPFPRAHARSYHCIIPCGDCLLATSTDGMNHLSPMSSQCPFESDGNGFKSYIEEKLGEIEEPQGIVLKRIEVDKHLTNDDRVHALVGFCLSVSSLSSSVWCPRRSSAFTRQPTGGFSPRIQSPLRTEAAR